MFVEILDLVLLALDTIAILIYIKLFFRFLCILARTHVGCKGSYFIAIGPDDCFLGEVSGFINKNKVKCGQNYCFDKLLIPKRIDPTESLDWLDNYINSLCNVESPAKGETANKMDLKDAKVIHVFICGPIFLSAAVAEKLLFKFDCKIIFYKYNLQDGYFPLPFIHKKRGKKR